jgi:hypothetical protein
MNFVESPQFVRRARLAATGSPSTPMSSSQRQIHHLLCLLVSSVILEGVARKLVPHALGIVIFFSKDILTLVLLGRCLKSKLNVDAHYLLGAMRLLVLLLLPCVLLTALHSPLLAFFGLKQYALFPTIAVAMCIAYLPSHVAELFFLFRLIALSVLVTTGVAVVQNKLPSASWLNLAVTGEEMSEFSAGGYLRVSSTFSFVGQYCFYLNALCYGLPAYFYLSALMRPRGTKWQGLALLGSFIVGMFVTGSRQAVLGNAAILGLAGVLLGKFAGGKALAKVLALVAVGGVLFFVIRSQHPEFFGAYEARTSGEAEQANRAEVKERITGGLLGWTGGSEDAPPSLFGYGLGVMSNGSDKLSSYAARWRASGFWMETDQGTTFFEGGWYLMFVWYGFRLWTMVYCLGLLRKMRSVEARSMTCFALGFIVIIGTVGTLGMQPPLSVWWWLAVGLVVCLANYDRARLHPSAPRRAPFHAGHL